MIHALRGSSPLPASDQIHAHRALGASALGMGSEIENRQVAAKAVATAFDGERALPKATVFGGNSAVISLRAAHADGAVANSLRTHFL